MCMFVSVHVLTEGRERERERECVCVCEEERVCVCETERGQGKLQSARLDYVCACSYIIHKISQR